MFRITSTGRRVCFLVVLAVVAGLSALPVLAQHGSEGTVSVTVLDPSGSVVQGAQLELRDLATNEARKAETQDPGTHSFVNLSLGTYRLSVTKAGFKTKVFDSVVVQASKTTDVSVTLTVGAVNETVEVTTSEAPLVETSSSAIGTVVDLKQIEDLPMVGRDLTQMTQLVPGYTGTLADGGGTWNGLPSIAQGSNIDGVVGNAGRMKFGGAAEPAVQPRIENIQEMTVQTDQLDLNQGFGNSSMQINFITRRGANAFHGRVYEDFRNSALNANSWFNNAVGLPKNHLILNEFGGSLGGRIIKDKLFFFGTYAMSKQPGKTDTNVWVLTQAAQAGNFTYTDTNNAVQTVNVLQLAANCTANCGGTPPTSTVNSQTAATLQAVNGVLQSGSLTTLSDPNFQQLNWQIANPTTSYFPTVRVDYNPNEKMRFNVAWNYTKTIQPGATAPNLPGKAFENTGSGNQFKSYTAALGFNWTFSPTLVNEFRGGFLYTANFFAYNGVAPNVDTQQIAWNFPNLPYPFATQMNGTNFQIPTGSYYPVFNASDTLTWQHRAHTMNFGFSWWREQNHYYNGVLGFPGLNLGLANGDPALGAFTNSSGGTVPNASGNDLTEAQELYAVLAGRISSVGGSYAYSQKTNSYCQCIGTYNLNELQKAFGLFFQDSYRVRPTLTVNYGLRWDLTWPDYDLTGAYHSAAPEAVWGPSGINNLFNPGSLKGTMSPILTQNSAPAKPWYVAPQPAFGIAWNPHGGDGAFGKLLGGDKTVIRVGFSLRRFTEPQQYFWNQASDYGAFYFQSFFLNANNTGQPGTFSPGSLALGDGLPTYGLAPQQYLKTEPVSDFTFLGGPGVNGVEGNIRQPYTESWNVGIQRQVGESRALEFRYIGNRSLRQWIVLNQNEVNIFENGFLKQFEAAQGNLAINQQNGITSFANNGISGQQALPVFDAAFAGEASGGAGVPLQDYANSNFINELTTGQAGSLANTLAGIGGTVPYLCNLVGSSFGPCLNNAGYSGAGAGYPINYFQVNPFAQGVGLSQLVAKGYSNYNALQVDFRQRQWHGLQFDANYTWSHTLGVSTQNNWQGAVTAFTLRDMRLSYGPTLFDIRHAVHINGTYDLPFGKGKSFASHSNVLDRIVGGWTLGSIFTFQTGNPFLLQGGYNTFNDYADSGVVLNGVTQSQLQGAVGVYRIPGTPTVSFINPRYLASATGGGANPTYITPNTTAGTIGQIVYLHGPRFVNDDLSITKHVPITEGISFSLQASMLNAFNHPSFQPGSGSGCAYYCYAAGGGFPNVQASGFGIGGTSPSYAPRLIELRANVEF
ncbi:MAG TPA: TonB-dependent receptor [Candidatus Sulfotelmatobacter sp.]|nr:TonB-dependent receptor [Candidatus Sulfotelmatobacter sp.]